MPKLLPAPLKAQGQTNRGNWICVRAWRRERDVRLAASGNYRCLISNDSGSLIGPVITVTVVREPLRFETDADGLQLKNGVVHLRLSGLAGKGPVVFYASSNLTDWNPVFTNSPTTGSLDFDDASATNQARFYRAVENP